MWPGPAHGTIKQRLFFCMVVKKVLRKYCNLAMHFGCFAAIYSLKNMRVRVLNNSVMHVDRFGHAFFVLEPKKVDYPNYPTVG